MAMQPISFRLEATAARQVKAVSKEQGIKESEFYREAVLEKLGALESESVTAELEELGGQLKRVNEALQRDIQCLRQELAVATEAILLMAGRGPKYTTEKARAYAKEFVDTHLTRKVTRALD